MLSRSSRNMEGSTTTAPPATATTTAISVPRGAAARSTVRHCVAREPEPRAEHEPQRRDARGPDTITAAAR